MVRFVVIVALMFVTSTASAAGLVPCGGTGQAECGLRDLTGMVQIITQFLLYIGVFIGVLMISYAGFTLVISRGNESALETAKSRIWNVVIGFVIMLLAYMIVNTLLYLLTGGGFEKWKI